MHAVSEGVKDVAVQKRFIHAGRSAVEEHSNLAQTGVGGPNMS